jgi:hypothetical protein
VLFSILAFFFLPFDPFVFVVYSLILDLLLVRAREVVPLKEMKAHWHACLDYDRGYEVGCKWT